MLGFRTTSLSLFAALPFAVFATSCGLLTDSGFQITDAGTTSDGSTTDSGTSDSGTDSGTPDAGGPMGAPGDIAFVMFDANNTVTEGYCFVAIVELAAGRQITFTDKDWVGGAFLGGEGFVVWEATTTHAAGTVVCITNVNALSPTASSGTILSSVAAGLNGSLEAVFAIEGTIAAPTAFLAGIANNGAGIFDLTGTGLVLGQTAMDYSSGPAFLQYTGARSGQATMAGYLQLIHNTANWTIVAAAPDMTAFTAP